MYRYRLPRIIQRNIWCQIQTHDLSARCPRLHSHLLYDDCAFQDDHRAFRRQLEDKRPVVENNLLSGRQYIANEPPLSDTSDSEGRTRFSRLLHLLDICIHENTNIQVFWDINAVSTGKGAGVLDGCSTLVFSVKHSKSSALGLPDIKMNTVRNVGNYLPIATNCYGLPSQKS